MKRHKPEGLDIATNTEQILTAIDHHSWFADVEKPNQTHDKYITYDISCNEDFALHLKYHDWKKIFTFFRDHPIAMGSFATKYVNKDLHDFNPQGKIRIRYSMMPEKYAALLELDTSTIRAKLVSIPQLIARGYEVHLNFSPVIVTDGWLDEYRNLFKIINIYHNVVEWAKSSVKAEVIFLTHNLGKHVYNELEKLPGESLLWKPEIQESKTSQYGGENIRYRHDLKAEYIKQFTELHAEMIPWNKIRYIF
jgi:spore photoproduct lyase